MKSLFFGGIHPADRKELSASAQLKPVNHPKQVTIPMSQHIGNPCTPMVSVGDYVKKGQKIGDGEGLCVPVHASVSGKVTAVEPRRHPNGREVLSVVIENDFHDRSDLTPNICAVYTEEAYRGQGVAGRLLNMAVEDLRNKGISPVYLLTDHTGFYERYGWEFLCMVQGDGEPEMTRMYIHK